MWIIKNDITDKKVKKKIPVFWITFIVVTLLFSITIKTKGRFTRLTLGDAEPIDWVQFWQYFPGILFSSFILSYLAVKMDNKKQDLSINHYLCEKCNKQKQNIEEGSQCECGGIFYHIDKMKWVDDDEVEKK